MGVGERAATTLALIVHELATNALKYGALSVDTGTLDISGTSENDQVLVTWTERGGPQVEMQDAREGYGSKLLDRSVFGLGGSLSTEWFTEGIVVTLKLSAGRLAA